MTPFLIGLNVKRQTPLNKIGKLSKTILYLMAGVLLIGTAIVYLTEINYITARGFYSRELEQKILRAKEENDKLGQKVVQIKSMKNLSDKVAELKMVPADEIIYYDTSGQMVAKK
jgi:cell division protein FtsL